MRTHHRSSSKSIHIIAAILLAMSSASPAYSAITWDGGGGTQWWFDPVNWSRDDDPGGPFLPPSQGVPVSATDTQINGVGGDPRTMGAEVVYDPAADPFFAAAAARPYADGFGPQTINQLYISRNTTFTNLLTINGDLTSLANVIVGRSGSTEAAANLGRINQLGGAVRINSNVLDLGNREASGWGNGIYDYRGGVLEVSLSNGAGVRLAAGGSAGPGGRGHFIMHNPPTPGYVRVFEFNVAAHAGNATVGPDGVTTGVGLVEFRYDNGGTRPIQVSNNLVINNGMVSTGTRSARLDLQLDSPVTLGAGAVPMNLGLFDVDFEHDPVNSGTFSGAITGAGDKGLIFSNADNTADYAEGATVSASFGNTVYNWTISYTGDITWTTPTSNVVANVAGPGTGKDVVLIGLSSQTVAVDDADFDGDSDVDGDDLLIWQRGLGVGASNATGDADGDTDVDAVDLSIWRMQFGDGPGGAGFASAVPEPAAGVMLAVALLSLAGLRRQRA
jgi:hypothetical protein